MDILHKVDGRYYTQNSELPIEERVFFTEGRVANKDDFRLATDEEVAEWKEYQERLEREHVEPQE